MVVVGVRSIDAEATFGDAAADGLSGVDDLTINGDAAIAAGMLNLVESLGLSDEALEPARRALLKRLAPADSDAAALERLVEAAQQRDEARRQP